MTIFNKQASMQYGFAYYYQLSQEWLFFLFLQSLKAEAFPFEAFQREERTHRSWTRSRENTQPKNNNRALFNFFRPHLNKSWTNTT